MKKRISETGSTLQYELRWERRRFLRPWQRDIVAAALAALLFLFAGFVSGWAARDFFDNIKTEETHER